MSSRSRVFISFILYGLGILSFLVADLYIVTNSNEDTVSNWAFYKSILFIFGSVCLLGFDQVLVRNPNLIRVILKKFIPQAVIMSLILVSLLMTFNSSIQINAYYLYLNVIIFSFILFLSAVFRAKNLLVLSQFTTNFWKVILLFVVYFSLFESVDFWYLVPLTLVFVIALLAYLMTKNVDSSVKVKQSKEKIRTTGLLFLLHNLTLILSIYGEQFFINLLGNAQISYVLFCHFVVFTPIALSVNGFIGFYLAPKIRRYSSFTLEDYQKLNVKVSIYTISISILSIFLGFYIFKYLYSDKIVMLNYHVMIALFILCLSRGKYTLASVCLGLFAGQKTLALTAKINWIILTFYIFTMVVLLSKFKSIDVVVYIAYLSAIHWCFRLFFSLHYAKKVVLNNTCEGH